MVQRIPRRPPPSVRTATTLLPLLLFLLVAVTSATLTLQSASQLFIDLQSCNASIASALASVECTFLTPSNITTRAQLLDIPCGDFNHPAEDSDATSIVPAGTADDGNGNGNGNGTHNLVSATFLETGITALEKNDFVTNTTNATMATVTRTYCARIDLLHALSSDPSSPELSIFAKKVNVTVSYRYSSLADFSVDGLHVVEYRPETAGASALRTTDLRAFQCDESGARDEYAVNVGDTLHLCVVNPDAYDDLTGEYDPDRLVDGRVDAYLETIDYLGFEGREGMVVEPVEGGATDFITEFDCGVDDGMKCHVKTLMVPSVFDAFGGEPMKALGVASVRFLDVDGGADGKRGLQGTDREGQWEDHRRRELQSLSITQDVVPFAVVFRLGPSTMAYTMQTDLDEARNGGFRKRCFRRWISLTLGVVVLTSWMTRHG